MTSITSKYGLYFLSIVFILIVYASCRQEHSFSPSVTIIETNDNSLTTIEKSLSDLYVELGEISNDSEIDLEIAYVLNEEESKLSESDCPSTLPKYMERWPPFQHTPKEYFNWYLNDSNTGLFTAANLVYKAYDKRIHGDTIKIAHIDTGYDPGHISISKTNIAGKFATVPNRFQDKSNPAKDVNKGYKGVDKYNYGHGTGTLGLLAGGDVPYEGQIFRLGGNPYAKIVVIRALHGSPIFGREKKGILNAVKIAIREKCDLITLSHGGGFNRRKIYRAIRLAYQNGIPVVAAAGNNFRWNKNWPLKKLKYYLASKSLAFPARYKECIAVTAATFEHRPYAFEFYPDIPKESDCFLEHMQTSYKKRSSKNNIIAGYSPNLSWALIGTTNKHRFSGGGTSGAVPLVAAALSLWLQLNKKRLVDEGFSGPEIVEAAKEALFKSAREQAPGVDEKLFTKYYGNGIVDAIELIKYEIDFENEIDSLPPADTTNMDIYFVETLFGKTQMVDNSIFNFNQLVLFNKRLEQFFVLDAGFYTLSEKIFEEFENEDSNSNKNLQSYRKELINYLRQHESILEFEKKILSSMVT